MFQSLSGFQVRCNMSHQILGSIFMECFNPYRVFKFVATERRTARRSFFWKFQSLSGFQVRCNLPVTSPGLRSSSRSFNPYRVFKFVATVDDIFRQVALESFQSLSGFQVRCNSMAIRWVSAILTFQSLSGFQVRCNFLWMTFSIKSKFVSIPIGFSSSLQL